MSKSRRAKSAKDSPRKKRGRDAKDAIRESSNDGDHLGAGGVDHDRSDEDWIAALASAAAAASSSASGPQETTITKAQRIERRNARRLEREERQRRRRAQRREREETKWRRAEGRRADRNGLAARGTAAAPRGSARGRHRHRPDAEGAVGRRKSDDTAMRVRELERRVRESVLNVERGGRGDETNDGRRGSMPYISPESRVRGKATRTSAAESDTGRVLQPRKRDYGGLGLARPSLYLPLRDPSFVPRLEGEFAEHVDGFFGKQRTKAMKKQNDGNMLWRQLARRRREGCGNGESGGDAGRGGDGTVLVVGGRKHADMTPDERVEAMISAGII